jgi:hypothetical protein
MPARTIVVFEQEWFDVTELAADGGCHRETVLRRIRSWRLTTWRTKKGLLVLADGWRRSVRGEAANDDESMDAKAG